MRRTSEAGRRRGDEYSVFPVPRVRRSAGQAREKVPHYREYERHYIQGDFPAY